MGKVDVLMKQLGRGAPVEKIAPQVDRALTRTPPPTSLEPLARAAADDEWDAPDDTFADVVAAKVNGVIDQSQYDALVAALGYGTPADTSVDEGS